jgi:hypothetical protein
MSIHICYRHLFGCDLEVRHHVLADICSKKQPWPPIWQVTLYFIAADFTNEPRIKGEYFRYRAGSRQLLFLLQSEHFILCFFGGT